MIIPFRDPAAQPLRISTDDLTAYAEGGLDPQRRAQIAGYLACNPDLAAEMMRNLHLRERTRAVGLASPPPRAARVSHAARLTAAGMACAVAGWAFATGLDEDGPLQGLIQAPEYVEDAVMAWHATHLRINLHSQSQTATVDADELERVMRIRLPAVPADWRLIDAQVYPSEAGPGVNMLLSTADGRQMNLFAVRSDTAATSVPDVTSRSGAHAAYWEIGGAAYVLTGEGSSTEMLAQATSLSRSIAE
jgi:anti-sigma factor RsiW